MNTRRLLPVAALAVAAAVALTGCGTTEAASGETKSGASLTVTDARGEKVALDGPAKKVVGTEWNVVEMLLTLGVTPVGAADVKGYTAWDTAETLPASTKDIATTIDMVRTT